MGHFDSTEAVWMAAIICHPMCGAATACGVEIVCHRVWRVLSLQEPWLPKLARQPND